MDDLISVCEEAARAAGEVLLAFQGRFSVRQKGPGDVVTDADLAAQQLVRQMVQEKFPDHGFVGEEEASSRPDAEFVWYVDPLDGTLNYVHGVQAYAVSLGVARRGELVAGVVYDPVARECFTSAAGGGTRLNGRPLKCSGVTRLADALVAVSLPVGARRGSPAVEHFLDVLSQCQAVRRIGSAALNLAYVAAGRFDAYWDLKAYVWDVAGGVLLVREAGGVVTGWNGGPFDLQRPWPVVAATGPLHRELIEILGADLSGAQLG